MGDGSRIRPFGDSDWQDWLDATVGLIHQNGRERGHTTAEIENAEAAARFKASKATSGRTEIHRRRQRSDYRESALVDPELTAKEYLFGVSSSAERPMRRGHLVAFFDFKTAEPDPNDNRRGTYLYQIFYPVGLPPTNTLHKFNLALRLFFEYFLNTIDTIRPVEEQSWLGMVIKPNAWIDDFFDLLSFQCRETPSIAPVARILWESLTVVRTDFCVVPLCASIPRGNSPIEGLYVPWRLAERLENRSASDPVGWIGAPDRPSSSSLSTDSRSSLRRVPLTGWTVEPHPCRVRAVRSTEHWFGRPASFEPDHCRDGFSPRSYWAFDAAYDNGPECVVCATNPAGVRLLPCKHKVVCTCCFTKLSEASVVLSCPMCRIEVRDAVRDANPMNYERVKPFHGEKRKRNDENSSGQRYKR